MLHNQRSKLSKWMLQPNIYVYLWCMSIFRYSKKKTFTGDVHPCTELFDIVSVDTLDFLGSFCYRHRAECIFLNFLAYISFSLIWPTHIYIKTIQHIVVTDAPIFTSLHVLHLVRKPSGIAFVFFLNATRLWYESCLYLFSYTEPHLISHKQKWIQSTQNKIWGKKREQSTKQKKRWTIIWVEF